MTSRNTVTRLVLAWLVSMPLTAAGPLVQAALAQVPAVPPPAAASEGLPPQVIDPAAAPVTSAPAPIDPIVRSEPVAPPATDPNLTGTASADAQPSSTPVTEPSPVVEPKADEQGFSVSSGGKKPTFLLKFKALLQVDNRKFTGDDDIRDSLLIRRARPYLEGTILGLVDFRLMPDFAGSQASLLDAYIDIHPLPWLRLRVGKYKAPIGLERLQSDADLPFIERAYDQNLSSTRDVGVQLWGEVAGGVVTYALGVFNGAPDNTSPDVDTGAQKDAIGRLFFQPFKAPGLEKAGNLGLGIAASTGIRDGAVTSGATQLSVLRTTGQATFFTYLGSATDPNAVVFAKGRQARVNPQLFYYLGGFGVLGEYIWTRQHVAKGMTGGSDGLWHRAWHATASYVVGGKNGFDGATPTSPWNPSEGKLGALEIAVRYQELILDEDTFPRFASSDASVRRARGFGASLTWAFTRTFRLATGFEHGWFEGGAKGGNRKDENVWLSRATLNL
jgi:phosphate-selective porin OprO/OprP